MLHPLYGQLPGPIPNYTNASMNDEDKALFWEGDLLSLQTGIKITAGLRYQDSDRSINRSSSTASVNASDDWDAWLPKLGVSFALSEQGTLFASAAKGFQSGGFNYYGGTPESAQYDSAESWNY